MRVKAGGHSTITEEKTRIPGQEMLGEVVSAGSNMEH
jgi:hypothetical protein